MADKENLKNQINESERRIESYEKKLVRSQVALMGAMITNTKPDEADVEYFKQYTSLIEQERNNLRRLYDQLKTINN